jgi:hypothetical protein
MIDSKPKGRLGKDKKMKLTAVRETNQRFTEHFVQKIQKLIIYR